MVTFNNSDSTRLIVGDNDSDGDFKGRIYADNRTLYFEKIGKGTQIIGGGNSSNGGTTVSEGVLYYNGPVKSKVTVASDATLGGTGTFNAAGTAIDLTSGATLIPMSHEGTGSMIVANDISFGGANTLKLTATPDALTPALNVGGSVIGADCEVDVVFESEKPGIYTLVKAQTAIEPKFVSATPNFKVYTSEDGLTVYGEKLDMGTVVIIR
jgi:autotransporter-associated beta strand protein